MSRIGTAGWRLTAVHAALDRLQQGVVLFGEARAVLHVNHAARSVLAEDDGLRLAVQPDAQHMLAVADPVLQDVLDGAIDRCLDREARAVPHFSAGVRIERPSGRAPMVLNFAALSESNEYIGGVLPRAIAFIGDGEASATVDASLLQRLFGLTGAEAQLALTLFRGETLAQAAATLTVSDNTAKSQLGRIFDKTGTQRQAQLMRLLAGLAAC
jgi:DNA-binding CsgD family transcriptional regulator